MGNEVINLWAMANNIVVMFHDKKKTKMEDILYQYSLRLMIAAMAKLEDSLGGSNADSH